MGDLDEVLGACWTLLEQREELPISDLNERLENMTPPCAETGIVAELTALCVFYEDLLKGKEEAVEKELFSSIVREIKGRIGEFECFVDLFDKKSDEILTVGGGMKYIKRLHRRLERLEVALASPAG